MPATTTFEAPVSSASRPWANSLPEMQQRVAALAGAVRPRSAEFEALNDLPEDVFDAIAHSGVTRIAVPKSLGGLEGTPIDGFLATSLLAEADPAVAWIVGQGIVQNAWVSFSTDEAFAREVMANPRALPATSINGKAILRPMEDGSFELEGSWRFLSGSSGATLIGGMAIVRVPEAAPEFRFVVVPADHATITKTWDSVGFRGTGSHQASVGPLRIPAGQTWVIGTQPDMWHPLASYKGGEWPIAASAAAVQIGIARRALDEAKSHARAKMQALQHTGNQAPIADNSAVRRQLARAEGTWASARAGVLEALGELWVAAQSGTVPQSVADRVQLACATAVWQSADVVTTAYNIGGTAAQANSHALQRCFRDGHILTAHISASDEVFEKLGRSLLAATE